MLCNFKKRKRKKKRAPAFSNSTRNGSSAQKLHHVSTRRKIYRPKETRNARSPDKLHQQKTERNKRKKDGSCRTPSAHPQQLHQKKKDRARPLPDLARNEAKQDRQTKRATTEKRQGKNRPNKRDKITRLIYKTMQNKTENEQKQRDTFSGSSAAPATTQRAEAAALPESIKPNTKHNEQKQPKR